MKGRPRKSASELEAIGSRNIKVDQVVSEQLKNPEIPPAFLSNEAKDQWRNFVGTIDACEADRMLLCVMCTLMARFMNEKVYGEDMPDGLRGQPIVSEESREKITKQLMDLSDRFHMNPLSRSRSGISKKKVGIKTR